MFSIDNATNSAIEVAGLRVPAKGIIFVPQMVPEMDNLVSQGLLEISSFSQSTRLYDFAKGQRLTVTGANVVSDPIMAKELLLIATKAMYITVAATDPVANNAAGSIPLLAGEKFHMQFTPGQRLAAVKDTEDGSLFVVPCL